ncbi:MAG: N-methyl-L-tryptophan oxidase [Chloroherpetonaceae bacterium]
MNRREFIIKTVLASAATLSYSQLYAKVSKEIESRIVQKNYDVIVLGVGSMGSATCYQLAKRGYKVLGIEQFDIPHEFGSHSGQSRIIRKAYGEASDYVPLLEKSYQNWNVLESETGYQVYYKTGLLYFAPKNHAFLQTVRKSSVQYNIPIQELTEEDCRKEYPQFKLPSNFERLVEPDAGFLTPEKSILLFVQQALLNGATIRTREKVLEWKYQNRTLTVKTDKGIYETKKIVITAGPWAGKLIPSLAQKLKVTRQAVAWVQPKKWEDFVLGKFPCWNVLDNGYHFYGFPILPAGQFGGPLGLKLALHTPGGDMTDPDSVDRNRRETDEQVLIQFLNKFIPDGYKNTLEVKTCLYTNTPDENFIVDYLPNFDKNVAIAAGFSGHGFKFVSAIGEIMADLVINGETQMPIKFLSLQRFEKG